MFRRILGSIFLYLYVIPAFSRAIRKIVIPTITDMVHKKMLDDMNAKKTEREFDRLHGIRPMTRAQ